MIVGFLIQTRLVWMASRSSLPLPSVFFLFFISGLEMLPFDLELSSWSSLGSLSPFLLSNSCDSYFATRNPSLILRHQRRPTGITITTTATGPSFNLPFFFNFKIPFGLGVYLSTNDLRSFRFFFFLMRLRPAAPSSDTLIRIERLRLRPRKWTKKIRKEEAGIISSDFKTTSILSRTRYRCNKHGTTGRKTTVPHNSTFIFSRWALWGEPEA